MSDHLREIARLQRELEQAKAREEQERREKEQAKAREEQAKAREEQLRRQNRKTTLDEYLYNCHIHLYTKLRFADKSKFSTGYTNVEGKYYPKWLRPWDNFADALRQRHFEVMRRVCGERRLFHQESTTGDLGTTISRTPAGNENAIEHFEKLAVEGPVLEIVNSLRDDEGTRTEYRFTGFRFSNNIREFTQPSDGSQVVEEDPSEERPERRRRTGPNKRVATERDFKRSNTIPDGGGLRMRLGGDESLAFIYDYKAAHKIAVEYLKPAVAKENLFMEVIGRINSDKYADAALRAQDRAEALIAMALTQVFDYMIRYGVAYGYVAAGRSLLFLYVDRADLQTLYCHPCVPDEDSELSASDWADKVSRTAVAQLVSFCLLSLQSEALRRASLSAALDRAEATLRKWSEPYEDAACLLEAEDTESPSASSSQASEGSVFTSKAGPTGREVPLRSRSSCKAAVMLPSDEDEEEEDGPEDGPSQSWTGASKRKEGPSNGSSEDEDIKTSDSAPTRQYCTQACLLGLKRSWGLDGNCPNVLSHRTAEGGTRHPIDANEFARLVGERLRQNPYRDCWALGGWCKMGAIGLLFKLKLAPYGYVFVGKGTLPGHLRRLQHEGRVYAQLERLQGEVVPVHLGLAHLDRGYVLPGGARVVHMMLMSWGGEVAAAAGVATAELAVEVQRSSQAVWAEGVDHGDMHEANMLWNNERRRVMVIDFDRAVLLPTPKHKQLFRLSGKKRNHKNNGLENYARKRPVPVSRYQGLAIDTMAQSITAECVPER